MFEVRHLRLSKKLAPRSARVKHCHLQCVSVCIDRVRITFCLNCALRQRVVALQSN